MEMYGKQNKWCFVPECKSTSARTPNKLFVSVPREYSRKKMWFQAAKREMPKSKSSFFCCEDHFNLEQDMKNFIRFKLMGGPIYLKKGVVPYRFDCQADRKRLVDSQDESHSVKRKRLIEETDASSAMHQFEEVYIRETPEVLTESVGIQVRPHFRSKATMCNLYKPRTISTCNNTELAIQDIDSKHILAVTQILISQKPKEYVGIPPSQYSHILKLMIANTKLKENHINLTLMKIKLNDSFSRLGDMFGITTSNARQAFKTTLTEIEPLLNSLIYWPERSEIVRSLPMSFTEKYSAVQSIINCLEIQIYHPKDPAKQTLTWSEHKKCNTLKYLISSTPSGFVNYISKGYGGRISDFLLVQESGYLEVIPQKSVVMAHEGFKDIAQLLQKRNCEFISLSNEETSETNSNLYKYVKKLSCKLISFEYLKPHSVVEHTLVDQTDNVVKTACALINLTNANCTEYQKSIKK